MLAGDIIVIAETQFMSLKDLTSSTLKPRLLKALSNANSCIRLNELLISKTNFNYIKPYHQRMYHYSIYNDLGSKICSSNLTTTYKKCFLEPSFILQAHDINRTNYKLNSILIDKELYEYSKDPRNGSYRALLDYVDLLKYVHNTDIINKVYCDSATDIRYYSHDSYKTSMRYDELFEPIFDELINNNTKLSLPMLEHNMNLLAEANFEVDNSTLPNNEKLLVKRYIHTTSFIPEKVLKPGSLKFILNNKNVFHIRY